MPKPTPQEVRASIANEQNMLADVDWPHLQALLKRFERNYGIKVWHANPISEPLIRTLVEENYFTAYCYGPAGD